MWTTFLTNSIRINITDVVFIQDQSTSVYFGFLYFGEFKNTVHFSNDIINRAFNQLDVYLDLKEGGIELRQAINEFFPINSYTKIKSQITLERGILNVDSLQIQNLIIQFNMDTKSYTMLGKLYPIGDFSITPEITTTTCISWISIKESGDEAELQSFNFQCEIKNFPDYSYLRITKTPESSVMIIQLDKKEYTWK